MSTKKRYSHTFFFDGRDSIFVRFILFFLNGTSISWSAPTLSFTENMIDVLSLPVGLFSVFPMTRNLVILCGLSSIERARILSP